MTTFPAQPLGHQQAHRGLGCVWGSFSAVSPKSSAVGDHRPDPCSGASTAQGFTFQERSTTLSDSTPYSHRARPPSPKAHSGRRWTPWTVTESYTRRSPFRGDVQARVRSNLQT